MPEAKPALMALPTAEWDERELSSIGSLVKMMAQLGNSVWRCSSAICKPLTKLIKLLEEDPSGLTALAATTFIFWTFFLMSLPSSDDSTNRIPFSTTCLSTFNHIPVIGSRLGSITPNFAPSAANLHGSQQPEVNTETVRCQPCMNQESNQKFRHST